MAEAEKPNAQNIVAMMVHTNEIEQETVQGTSYIDCYKGTDWRRTEIACMTFAVSRTRWAKSVPNTLLSGIALLIC
jgi:hypothetical protein